jgi:hypothetical protein
MSTKVQADQLGVSLVTNFKNILINGDFQIDQRNGGVAKTVNGSAIFGVDRWKGWAVTGGVFTSQQVTSSTTVPPSGAMYANKIQVTTADASIGGAEYYLWTQLVEGKMASHLLFGTPYARTVTLSFWVRSSLTGMFSGSIINNAQNRSYPFTFTITAAETWEKKSVTIPGCTDGVWPTDNSMSFFVMFNLGSGYVGTANTWNTGAACYGATGSVNLISTLNATMYLADVQLEVGTSASDFERLPTDMVLKRCQRYYEVLSASGVVFYADWYGSGTLDLAVVNGFFATQKRAPAVCGKVGTWNVLNCAQPMVQSGTDLTFYVYQQPTAAGRCQFYGKDATTYITADAEL